MRLHSGSDKPTVRSLGSAEKSHIRATSESPRWLLLTASGLSPDSDLQMNVDDVVVCLTSNFVPNNFLFYTNWLWVRRCLLLEVQVASVCVCVRIGLILAHLYSRHNLSRLYLGGAVQTPFY